MLVCSKYKKSFEPSIHEIHGRGEREETHVYDLDIATEQNAATQEKMTTWQGRQTDKAAVRFDIISSDKPIRFGRHDK